MYRKGWSQETRQLAGTESARGQLREEQTEGVSADSPSVQPLIVRRLTNFW